MIVFFKYWFFLGGIIPLTLGSLIYLGNRKSWTGRTYLGLSLSCAIWSFGFLGLMSAANYQTAYFWRMFMDIGAVILPAFWMHFLYTVLNLASAKRKEIFFYYLAGLLLVILNVADYLHPGIFVEGVVGKGVFNYYPVAGLGYYLFLLFYVAIVPYSFYYLIRGSKDRSGVESKQIRFLLAASVLGFGGGGTAFLLTFGVPIAPYGVILFALYPIIIAYAISKYHLFNIKVVVTELLTFGIWVFVLARTYVADTTTDIILNGGLLIFLVFSGVLLIRSVMQEIRQREQIEKLSEEKSEFMSFASHQVKGPLTNFKLATNMLLSGDYGPLTEQVQNVIKGLYNTAEKAIPMVQNFLDVSKLEQTGGGMQFDKKPFDFRTVVQEVVKEQRLIAAEKNIIINFVTENEGNFNVNADASRMKDMVFNLVDNAVKYTPAGSVKVTLRADNQNKKILLSVKDSGVGLLKEDLARLFTKFGRGKDSKKINTSSSGLGLYLAKQIIDAHGGRIFAESEGAGKGSTFFVELPFS